MSSADESSPTFSPEESSFIVKLEKELAEEKAKAKQIYLDAKAEIEAKLALDKEKIKDEAKQELLQKIREEKELLDKKTAELNDLIKEKIIAKITRFQKDANVVSLRLMNLDALKHYYKGVIDVEVSERKKLYQVTCPKCKKHLGNTTTHEDGVRIFQLHRKECPKVKQQSSAHKWMVLAIALGFLTTFGYAFYRQNKHAFKKGKKDEPTE